MNLDSIDARLEWRLAPEIIFIPTLLDFGRIEGGEKILREIKVCNQSGPLQGYAVACSNCTPWFRILQVLPESMATEANRLTIVVEVDPTLLTPHEQNCGWIEIQIDQIQARLPVVAATSQSYPLPLTKQTTHWRQNFILTLAALLLVSVGLSWLSSNSGWTLVRRPLPTLEVTRPWPQRYQLSFAVSSDQGLALYTTAAQQQPQPLDLQGWSPAWSPNRTSLAFLAGLPVAPQLYLFTPGQHAPLPLTSSYERKAALAWSADGEKIAFLAGPPDAQSLQVIHGQANLWGKATPPLRKYDEQIAVIQALMHRPRHSNSSGTVQSFAWSSVGQRLLFDYHQGAAVQILQVDERGELRTIAEASWSPTWSPDDTELAAVAADGLFRMRLGNPSRYYLTPRQAIHPRWSPAGQQIAFLASANAADTTQPNQAGLLGQEATGLALWVIDASGSHESWIASDCLAFAWSPDGQQLAYVTGSDAQETLTDGPLAPLYYLWTVVPGEEPILFAEVNSPEVAWQPLP